MSLRGLVSWRGLSSDVFFCLQIDGPITGRLKSERGGGRGGLLTAVYGLSMQVTLKPIS